MSGRVGFGAESEATDSITQQSSLLPNNLRDGGAGLSF